MAARAWWLSAVLLAAGLAGCASDAPDVAPPAGDGGAANDTPPRAADGSGPPGQGAERGVAQAPTWVEGQWWRMQVEHRFADTFELTLVVADVTETSYLVGFDDPDVGLAALPIHLPPAGMHTRPDLGFWWHEETVSFLSFPLEDGKGWTASFRGESLTYTATLDPAPGQAPRFVVTGRTADGVAVVRGLYDAGWGHFTELAWGFDVEAEAVTRMSMVAGGTGHTGAVFVPSMSDAYHGQASGPNPEVPGLPSPTAPASFDVPASSSALVLAGFMGGGPGTYEIAWQGPAGGPQLFTQNNPPGQDTVALAVAVLQEAHTGAWHVGLNAGGPGFVLAEAIVVTLTPVTLP